MADSHEVEGFPRERFRELLRSAEAMFASQEDRRRLLADLGLSAEGAERQQSEEGLPRLSRQDAETLRAILESERQPASERSSALDAGWRSAQGLPPSAHTELRRPARDVARERPRASGAPQETARELVEPGAGLVISPVRFATELVDRVSRASHLDAALTLARRAIREIEPDMREEWTGLLQELDRLNRRHRGEGRVPDLAGYREWQFECRHQYSLTDRFFGRQDYLAILDDWTTARDGAAIWCICALGGGGKSALAWQWLTKEMPTLRRLGYQGAFWCSFYEKNFNFDEFVRTALAFAGDMEEERVRELSRSAAEDQLIEAMTRGRFIFVLDGLERLMNGYATVAERAVDADGLSATPLASDASTTARRMVDRRDGAFLARLAAVLTSKVLLTTRLVPADLEAADGRGGEPGLHPLPGVVLSELPGLEAEDTAALWQSIVGTGEVSDDLRAIFRLCGHHPLVISILARSVAHAGGDWVGWREDERHRDFDVRGRSSEAEVRTHIIGICMRDLDERCYDILGFLTTTGKPMIRRELADLALLGSAASGNGRWTDEEEVDRQLRLLLDLGLIGEATPLGQPAEYDVHPVVRSQVWELLLDPERERFLEHAYSGLAAVPGRRDPGLHELSSVIALFSLHVRAGQLERAWELLSDKLYPPLRRHNENLKLLALFSALLPDGSTLALLPLDSRRAQANAAGYLADLLLEGGDGSSSDTLLRWCGAIRLQIGDHMGFLYASHSRAWRTLYEGRLFETERSLREIKVQAMAFRAIDIQATVDCWIGILLALRGDRSRAEEYFEAARGRTQSERWWLQGLAEGLAYLEDPVAALRELERLRGGAGHADETEPMQLAWEEVTEGMAHLQNGDMEKALDALSSALTRAHRANYAIVQCFALPCIAEIELGQGGEGALRRAEATASSYYAVDPHEAYVLCASHARRVLALCRRGDGDAEGALRHANRAYELAACDGPPFVYAAGLLRALDVLGQCGAYVPATRATLDPEWRERLIRLEADEREVAIMATRQPGVRRRRPLTREEERAALERAAMVQQASAEDRAWWREITGHAAIQGPLTDELSRFGIGLPEFRNAFDKSPHKSLTVVFNQILAERIVPSLGLRQVRDLNDDEGEAWLSGIEAHVGAVKQFRRSPLAQQLAQPFELSQFRPADIGAFLADHKRRISVDADPRAREWWARLEQHCQHLDLLVLAEAVLRMEATLADLVAEIAVDGESRTLQDGLTYGFQAMLVRSEVERLESHNLSKVEGWRPLDILLRLQDVKLQLGWSGARPETKKLWRRLEAANEADPARVLRLAEQLAQRRATLDEYHDAQVGSGTDNIQACLAYLDYRRLRDETWDGRQPWPRTTAAERWAYESAPPSFTDASELSADQVSGRLGILLDQIGRAQENDQVRAWWDDLAERCPPETALRIVEELHARRARLSHLRDAHVDGESRNMLAALAYLDFTLLSQAEDRLFGERASAHNVRGNELYREGQFAGAARAYEAAIRTKPSEVFFTNLAGANERLPDNDPAEAMAKAVEALHRGLDAFPGSSSLKTALERAENKQRLLARGALPLHGTQTAGMLPIVTPIAMEVGANLMPLVEGGTDSPDSAIDRIPELRERILQDTGVRVPGVRFRGNETDIPGGSYLIMLDEVPLVMGTIDPEKCFTTVPEADLADLGIPCEPGASPVDQSEGFWIPRENAGQVTGSVWDATEYMLRHLEAVLRANLSMFCGLQETVNMLERVWSDEAREIAASRPLVARFMRMTQALVDEAVPLLDMPAICSAFLRHDPTTGMDDLIRAVRALPPFMARLPGNSADCPRYELAADLERDLAGCLHPVGDEFVMALEPELTQDVLSAVRSEVDGRRPAVLIIRDELVRRYLRKVVVLEFPRLYTMSRAELRDDSVTPTVISLD